MHAIRAFFSLIIHIIRTIISEDCHFNTYTYTHTLSPSLVPDMSKKFCPDCGYDTLKRVSVRVNSRGIKVYVNWKKPISLRGSKYSVPTPKGGRHAANLILTEDEYEEAIAKKKRSQRKKKKYEDDIFSADFLDASLFERSGARRTGKQSGTDRFGLANGGIVIGHGRRNPNEGRKGRGKGKRKKK
jgi:RNA-binding protein NOB1